MDPATCRLVTESFSPLATLRDLGLGIPHQISALPLRVESSALFNFELCAFMGWAAEYSILKNEGDGVSMRVASGARSRLTLALGVEFRTSTKCGCTNSSCACPLSVFASFQPGSNSFSWVKDCHWDHLADALSVVRSIGIGT